MESSTLIGSLNGLNFALPNAGMDDDGPLVKCLHRFAQVLFYCLCCCCLFVWFLALANYFYWPKWLVNAEDLLARTEFLAVCGLLAAVNLELYL